MPVSLQLLSQIPLLQRLPPEVMARLSALMQLQTLARRAVIMSKEAPCLGLGFLIEGRLQGVDFTVDGRGVGLYFVEAGDYFGELSVIDKQLPAEYLIAANKSTVAILPMAHAQLLIAEHSPIAQALLQRLATRVREITYQRTLLGLPNPVQRLCALLLRLPHRLQNAQRYIDPAPTHQELAIMINASRETVTRAFQVMTAHRWMIREGTSLQLLDVASLQAVAEGRQEAPKAI